jgi:hypothetical protein
MVFIFVSGGYQFPPFIAAHLGERAADSPPIFLAAVLSTACVIPSGCESYTDEKIIFSRIDVLFLWQTQLMMQRPPQANCLIR